MNNINLLSETSRASRLAALEAINRDIATGQLLRTHPLTKEVNNHIHSWYSFSPYSPAMAAFKAWDSGLSVCGIIDHESVSGGIEMRRACGAFGLGGTVGFELRVDFQGSDFEDKKINNPDMNGIAYTVIHGVSELYFNDVSDFLHSIRETRVWRSKKQTERLSTIFQKHALPNIVFADDVLAISMFEEGGSITERHILYAASQKLIEKAGKGEALLTLLKSLFNIEVSANAREYLLDVSNPHYEYDLLGVLKQSLLPQVYIVPTAQECIAVKEVTGFANDIHAIPAYPYLGDILNSVTGDKKAEQFEDAYIEKLFEYIVEMGYKACTYMPPRNTITQLTRVSDLCKKYGLMEISGVDINSPRQEFLYKNPPEFIHLDDSAWALVAHENILYQGRGNGLFDVESDSAGVELPDRITKYAEIGKNIINDDRGQI